MGPSFAYASYISDDPDRSAQVLGRLGVPVIWEGMHPFFGVPAIVAERVTAASWCSVRPTWRARIRRLPGTVPLASGCSTSLSEQGSGYQRQTCPGSESSKDTALTRAHAARQWLSACRWGTARRYGSSFAWRSARPVPPGPPSRGWRAYQWSGPRSPGCAPASPGWV